MLGVTVSGGGVSTPYTSWFMFILCEFFAVPGREGPGGARAGGEESIMPGNRNSQNKKRRGQRNVELKEVRKLEERQRVMHARETRRLALEKLCGAGCFVFMMPDEWENVLYCGAALCTCEKRVASIWLFL